MSSTLPESHQATSVMNNTDDVSFDILSSRKNNEEANLNLGTSSVAPGTQNNNHLPMDDIDGNSAFENWNLDHIRTSLRDAVEDLSNHSLKLASKWAAEQLLGLPTPTSSSNVCQSNSFDNVNSSSPRTLFPIKKSTRREKVRTITPDYDLILYAKNLLDLGEYERAAHVLSSHDDLNTNLNKEISMSMKCNNNGPPLPHLSPTGIYFRAYALYLAGERRKEEEVVELRDPLERCSITNLKLPQLLIELGKSYNDRMLDAFGLYIYGIVLKESQKQSSDLSRITEQTHEMAFSKSHKQPKSQNIFIQSILQYPYNWSAWLDLAEICIESPVIVDEVELELAPLSTHWMYHFFLIHVFIEQQQHDQAIVLIEKLNQGEKNTFETRNGNENKAGNHRTSEVVQKNEFFSQCNFLKAMTAVAHYNMRDFENAQRHFQELCQRDPYRLEQMDIFSNILYVKESKAELSHLAHSAVRIDKYRPETCCIVGNYYSLKGLHEKAVHYFQRALRLDRTFLSAWTLMGHEFVEMKNTAAAIEAYRRAVDINPRDYRAWYGLGQTYEILNMLLYALFYYRKATALRPYDARMWCAMGGCYLGLGRRLDAMRSYERAVSNHDREGIATQKLATLYRDEGENEKAADCYMRHLKLRMQQQSSSMSLSSAPKGFPWGHISDENAINLVHVDAQEAEALLYLAFYHRDNGNYETASRCCSRLLEYPGPEKEEAKALLREIRSREGFRKNSDDEYGNDDKNEMSMSMVDSVQFDSSVREKETSFEFSP